MAAVLRERGQGGGVGREGGRGAGGAVALRRTSISAA